MSFESIEKIYSFLFFTLSFSFLFLIAFFPDSINFIGGLLVITSVICLSRFLWIIVNKDIDDNKLLSEQILLSLEKENKKNKANILKRLISADFLIWILLVFIGVIWTLFCTAYPNEITAIKTLYFEFSQFFYDFYNQKEFTGQSLIMKIVPFIATITMFLLLCFLQVSLLYSRFFVKLNITIFLPIFLMGLVFILIAIGRVIFFPWPDANFLIGGGLGASKIIFLTHPSIAMDSASFFLSRFLNIGFIGAYGFYALFLPPLSVFFYVINVKLCRTALAWVGIITIAFIVMMDMFCIYNLYGNAVMMAGWLVVMACWGNSGFKTMCLRR